MFKEFYIQKLTNTYADTLEMYGLCIVLEDILNQLDFREEILIEDNGHSFKLTLSDKLSSSDLNRVKFRQFYPYIEKTNLNKTVKLNTFIYAEEQRKYKSYQEKLKSAKKDKNIDISLIQRPHELWFQVQSLYVLQGHKLSNRFLENNWTQDKYKSTIEQIFNHYSNKQPLIAKKKEEESKIQLTNPACGKGINKVKSNGISDCGLTGWYAAEFLKIIGYLHVANARLVSKDAKVFCIYPRYIHWKDLRNISNKFNEYLPTKGHNVYHDISTIFEYISTILKYIQKKTLPFKATTKEKILSGFQSVHFKDMGNVKSVSSINFYRFPSWISLNYLNPEDNLIITYLNIIDEHKTRLGCIDRNEEKLFYEYRNFISSENVNVFLDFLAHYSVYLIQSLDQGKYYIKPFLIINLQNLMKNLSEGEKYSQIFENQGFQNIASAIRQATLTAMYANSKGDKKFTVHYGMAQDLKRKSINKADLINYLSEFIGFYNKETARYEEQRKLDLSKEEDRKKTRSKIKVEDVEAIIKLIDEYDPEVVGKLLMAYGYARE